ncbi:MAG: heparan-alpha-glucosaminide N-acetyltransferase [Archaeoglobaceae archaeon]
MRLWKLDLLRGFAVLLMLIYHFFFDAQFFGLLDLEGTFWFFFPRFIGGMFIFISGLTMALTYKNFQRILRKVAKLSLIAVSISFITFSIFDEQPVYFGIIHFFAVATLLSVLFVKMPKLSLIFGIFLFFLGFLLQSISLDTYFLLWIGIRPKNFSTLDYYPLMPWFGIMLFGLYFGNKTKEFFKNSVKFKLLDPLAFLGRNSLAIYLIQHPLIVIALCFLHPEIAHSIYEIVEL